MITNDKEYKEAIEQVRELKKNNGDENTIKELKKQVKEYIHSQYNTVSYINYVLDNDTAVAILKNEIKEIENLKSIDVGAILTDIIDLVDMETNNRGKSYEKNI